MEAERRAVAERLKPTVTLKKEEPKCEDAGDDDSKVVLPPLPLRMTQNACIVVEGAKTTSARPPVPPGAPDPLEAPSKSLDGPLKDVASGDSSHRQTSQLPLRTGPSTPPGKGATPSATPDPIPYIVIEEATPRSVRTRRPQCVYQPPGFPTLQFDTDGRYVVAKKSQGVTLEKEEPEPPSDRAESPEVFLPPLPAPLRPPNPCHVVKNAGRTTIQPPTRQRAPKSSKVSPTPSAGKIEDPLEAPSRSLDGPLNNVASGDSSHRQTSQLPLRTGPSTPPGKGATPRATPDPIPYIVIEEATPKNVRTRRPQCVYQPPGFPTLQLDTDARCVVAKKSQGVTLEKGEPEPGSDRAESPEVFLPPLPAPLRPPNPCNVVKNAERTAIHSSARQRAPKPSNVSPTRSAGKIEATDSTCSRASPSGRVHLPSLPDPEPKSSKVSKASPTIETNPSGLLELENVSVRSTASESPPVLNDGHKRSESCRSGDSGRSDETIKASKVGFPRGPGVATVQQPTPSGHSPAPGIGRNGTLEPRSTNRPCTEHLRPPIASSRRPPKPELASSHHVPAVSETDRGREPTAHSNGSTSRQVGLSAKVIWARQLKYRLDFCATVGDRVKYAAAAQDALKAG
ncbi:hypothetical protein FS837_002197 [Tulasnella sp. UAMH 9824]|nr:hypothetical protein FS837_002197 [Tulasnella sp. UAMH 9824]